MLAFCIFRVEDYIASVVPRVQELKFATFGHDMVVLHEREIRKAAPPFDVLQNVAVRAKFMASLSELMAAAPMMIVAAVIDKAAFKRRRGVDTNPYHVALEFGLERVFLELQGRGQVGRPTSVVFESRGREEDRTLELEFLRICSSTRVDGLARTLRFQCASKGANSSGLQLADMSARPIGLHHLRPEQPNRAWDVIQSKIRRDPRGRMEGWGLKTYP